jgi:hypothetical protein
MLTIRNSCFPWIGIIVPRAVANFSRSVPPPVSVLPFLPVLCMLWQRPGERVDFKSRLLTTTRRSSSGSTKRAQSLSQSSLWAPWRWATSGSAGAPGIRGTPAKAQAAHPQDRLPRPLPGASHLPLVQRRWVRFRRRRPGAGRPGFVRHSALSHGLGSHARVALRPPAKSAERIVSTLRAIRARIQLGFPRPLVLLVLEVLTKV